MIPHMPDIPPDIFVNFNAVKFNDEIHKYYINGQELTSVTTIIGMFENGFDEEYWSTVKAEEFNITKKECVFGWNYINKKATTKGSIVHNYAENLFNNKYFPYPKELVHSIFGYDPIYNNYLKEKTLVDKFYNDSFNKIIPIKTELVVYDINFRIGGMLDLLVYNVKAGEFQIWDYKTNKALDRTSKHHFKGCLSDLEECHLEIYSIQLAAYKHIIEKNTNMKLGKSYLVWVNEANDSYEIIPAKDRLDYAKKMMTQFSLGLVA
jgi:hypothetical protein